MGMISHREHGEYRERQPFFRLLCALCVRFPFLFLLCEMLGGLILGGFFVRAGVTKMMEPLAFTDSIASFKILPMILINPLALSLPPLEVLTGLILIGTIGARRLLTAQGAMNRAPTSPSGDGSYTRRLQRLGAFSVIILCSIFCLAILSALLRGINVDCGCFGSGKPSVFKTWLALGRDIPLLAAATILYRGARQMAPAEG